MKFDAILIFYLLQRRSIILFWVFVWNTLSFFDKFRFSKLLSKQDRTFHANAKSKNDKYLSMLIKRKFGIRTNSDQHIFTLSDYILSYIDKAVLSRGLDFCIPPSVIDRTGIFAEFELMFSQLRILCPSSNESIGQLKARLNEYAHSFVNSMVRSDESFWQKNHFQAAKLLKARTNIYITKPDKISGVVILNRADYISKMATILEDTSKFQLLGNLTADHTLRTEIKLQKSFYNFIKITFTLKKSIL